MCNDLCKSITGLASDKQTFSDISASYGLRCGSSNITSEVSALPSGIDKESWQIYLESWQTGKSSAFVRDGYTSDHAACDHCGTKCAGATATGYSHRNQTIASAAIGNAYGSHFVSDIKLCPYANSTDTHRCSTAGYHRGYITAARQ